MKMNYRRYRSVFFISATFCAIAALTASTLDACTLWAAVGARAAQGGSIIAKNRDWLPEPSEVRLVNPPTGFRFLGLYPIREGKRRNIVAGVNEKGLVVVTATAGSIPREVMIKGGRGVMQQLLTDFPTVEEVLANRTLFARTHSAMYLIADRRRIAWIEVAPEGRFSVRDTANGVLAHTNHYLDEQMIGVNEKIGRSSRVRIGRIGELLEGHALPFTLEDFIAISRDRNDGPDNSVWRTGGKPEGNRTLASWIVSLPKEAPPEIFIRLANPGEAERTVKMALDGPFWKKREETVF